jgi:putative cell wall-binding protein/spore germination protein YaaH
VHQAPAAARRPPLPLPAPAPGPVRGRPARLTRPARWPAFLFAAAILVAASAPAPAPSMSVADAHGQPPGGTDRTVAAAATPSPLPASSFARRLSSEVYAFLPYWQLTTATDAYLRYDLVTDIALFSIGLTSSGTIATTATGYPTVTGSTAATIVSHAHAAGVRVDLTVTSFGYAKNTAFFTDPTAMSTAVAAIAAMVKAKGLDGVDLDIESLYNANFAAYGVFVGQLRTALRAANPAARVSVATNASLSGAAMAVQALANGADRVFIMGYNYRSAGSNPAGSIAPLVRADGGKSLTWTLDTYASYGIAADRLLLGLPYYGRTWSTTTGDLHAPTIGSVGVFFPGTDLPAVPAGTQVQHDPIEGSAWFAVQDPTTLAWTETYFDDATTLKAKYALATSRRLAGVGIWALGYDRGASPFWDAIVGAFGTVRRAGVDRYGTAAAVSADAFPTGAGVAYIATGTTFPDALAAAAAAGTAKAPVLLVTPTAIPPATAAELSRLKPARIVVVGGTAAVSDAVLGSLTAYTGGTVTRIGGADRYATAAALSSSTFPAGALVAYVVTGTEFADAVSAAPAAARGGGPVLLTRPTTAPAVLLAELTRLHPTRIVIVGGTGVVAPSVVAAIAAAVPGASIARIAGADRYATSAAVAATFPAGVPIVYAASGVDFPDALAAAAAAGAQGSPLVITNPALLPASIRDQIVRLQPTRAVVAGGSAVVWDQVLVAIRTAVATP